MTEFLFSVFKDRNLTFSETNWLYTNKCHCYCQTEILNAILYLPYEESVDQSPYNGKEKNRPNVVHKMPIV